jgi:hypothetical protein
MQRIVENDAGEPAEAADGEDNGPGEAA